MRSVLFFVIFFSFFITKGQNKVYTKKGHVSFEASVPTFEEIKATSNNAFCILSTSNGEFNSFIFIKSFRFKMALMEEHFNEKYLESDKFPKAILKGKLLNFENITLSNSFQTMILDGNFELHGKTIPLKIPIQIKKINNTYEINADFDINLSDFDIKIPMPVSNKISKDVNIQVNYVLI